MLKNAQILIAVQKLNIFIKHAPFEWRIFNTFFTHEKF